MNSTSSEYLIPIFIVLVGGIYILYSLNSNIFSGITNPTAQQSISNKAYIMFMVYSAIAVAVILISLQTKRIDLFFVMLVFLSFFSFIVGKTWQYSPQ
jgi:hypothetical protein